MASISARLGPNLISVTPGKVIRGAHAVDREFRVMKALHEAGDLESSLEAEGFPCFFREILLAIYELLLF